MAVSVRERHLVPVQLMQALLAQRRSLGAPRCATIIFIVLPMGIGIGKFVGMSRVLYGLIWEIQESGLLEL